jgi:alpha-ribazole phosphatase
MNPYTLTLMRHGCTEENGPFSGRRDIALTEAGQLQMERSWQQVVALAPVSTMACSPLVRCREFAVRHALALSVPLKVDERFSEYDFGNWSGCSPGELGEPDWEKRWQTGALIPPGGESREGFHTRVLTGFSEWIAATRGSHRVLVTHAPVITALLAELLDMGRDVARLITVQPGGFVQLSILEDHPAYLMRLDAPAAQ